MEPAAPIELDVRPLSVRGRPPMPAIQDALSRLEPGQSLRLIAPFEPVPLYDFLAQRGFTHEATETEPGLWTVLFVPETA